MLFLLVVFGFVCLVHTTSTSTCRFTHADRDNDAGAVLRRSRWNCPCGVAQRLGHLRQGTACRSSAESCTIYTLHRRGPPRIVGTKTRNTQKKWSQLGIGLDPPRWECLITDSGAWDRQSVAPERKRESIRPSVDSSSVLTPDRRRGRWSWRVGSRFDYDFGVARRGQGVRVHV